MAAQVLAESLAAFEDTLNDVKAVKDVQASSRLGVRRIHSSLLFVRS